MSKKIKLIGLILVLSAAALACNLNLDLGGPDVPEGSVPVSTEAAASLVEAWQRAFEIAGETGEVSLTLTEEQLTSYLAISMADNQAIPLTNPQVILRDGEMEIVGTYKADAISANVGIVMEVAVSPEGTPSIEVTSGSLGPLPVPEELLKGVSDVINEALTGQVGASASGFTLNSIVISEGNMSLVGTIN